MFFLTHTLTMAEPQNGLLVPKVAKLVNATDGCIITRRFESLSMGHVTQVHTTVLLLTLGVWGGGGSLD